MSCLGIHTSVALAHATSDACSTGSCDGDVLYSQVCCAGLSH